MGRNLTKVSLDHVARRVLKHCATGIGQGSDGGRWTPSWEDYPALSAEQWAEVRDRVIDLAEAANVTEEEFLGAYEYLTGEQP